MTKNIMIVGVGGQGSLLASKLLGHLLLTEGYDVKVSEVHGMSQRGGKRRYICEIRGQGILSDYRQGRGGFYRLLRETGGGQICGISEARWTDCDQHPGGRSHAGYYRSDGVSRGSGGEKMESLGIAVDAMDCLSLADQAGSPRRSTSC